jgi:hypothetical protein
MLSSPYAATDLEKESWEKVLPRIAGIDIMECPLCHGRMGRKENLLPVRGPPR